MVARGTTEAATAGYWAGRRAAITYGERHWLYANENVPDGPLVIQPDPLSPL